MTAAQERTQKIDELAARITVAIRRGVVEPALAAIETVERIRDRDRQPEVSAHVVEQFSELSREVNSKLNGEAEMIRRLSNGLLHFERRLIQMSSKGAERCR